MSLCAGRGGKKGWGLAHINERGHFGGGLSSSDYALNLIAAAIDDGDHGDYKGQGGITNYRLRVFCTTPKFSNFIFGFTVRVGVRNSDNNIQTAFIEDNYLDSLDPEQINASCRAGHSL